MLQVVTWLWVGGTVFTPEHVNRLASMLRRHLHAPYELTCITDHDDLADFDPGVRAYPMVYDHAEMRAGTRACFRRLALHGRELANRFGPRILQLDLDCVIVDDITPIVDRNEPLVLVTQRRDADRVVYNPSVTLMTAGVLAEMYDRFRAAPEETSQAAKRGGWSCSDMAVINYFVHGLPPDDQRRPATWSPDQGVASYWRDVKAAGGALPPGSRIVLFYGAHDPSDLAAQAASPWILNHWR